MSHKPASSMDPLHRPSPEEHDPYYAGYIGTVPDGLVLDFLRARRDGFADLLASVPANLESYRYAPGKWSIREVAGHVVDTERVFAYRALQFARAAPEALPGMDQEVFAAGSTHAVRPLASIRDEFVAVRDATLALVESFTPEIADRTGVASGVRFTVRALVWILAGHEKHHANVLRDRYLAA